MHEKLFLVGIGLIFLGIFVTIVASFLHGKGKVEAGGIIFIGPIPIGFATNQKILYLLIAFSLIVLLIFLFSSRII